MTRPALLFMLLAVMFGLLVYRLEMPLGRCGVETVQGVGSLPILRAMVRAWPRQRRNAFFRSAAGRIIRHTRLLTSCQQLQPSSAVVSAAVVGTGLLRDRGRPLHAAFVLTEFKNQRETGVP